MKTKTIHRIAADKVGVEDVPNANCETGSCNCNEYYGSDKCLWPDDNSRPHKIVSVPVEPQPDYWVKRVFRNQKTDNYFTKDSGKPDGGAHSFGILTIPYHPDDTLTLMEDWACDTEGPYLKSSIIPEHDMLDRFDWQPASTMPPELDSQCQQLTVVKVLGVEERKVSIKITGPQGGGGRVITPKDWHFKVLATETPSENRHEFNNPFDGAHGAFKKEHGGGSAGNDSKESPSKEI